MKEIFALLNEEDTGINTSILHHCNELLGMSIKHTHRIIYFDHDNISLHYIDFAPYRIEANTFYIIPKGHVYYLPLSVIDYSCIEIPEDKLTDIQLLLIYGVKYNGKDIKVSQNIFDQIIFSSAEIAIISIFELLQKRQINTIASVQYLSQGQKLHRFITQHVNAQHPTISELAKHLCLSERTLMRISKIVFYQPPKAIFQYHLFVLSTMFILFFPAKSFAEIALSLGFKETTHFNRYIKSISGMTPTEIRHHYTSFLTSR